MTYSDKSTNVHKKPNGKNSVLSTRYWFLIIAAVAAVGYVMGMRHYEIEAAIGPVFGYKPHPSSINLNSLQETYNALSANFDGSLDMNKLIAGANKGMVDAAGDDYTVYMTPTESTEYSDSLSGKIGGGIGAEIGLRNKLVTVIRVLAGNPAEKIGLAAGDIIVAINDQSTEGMSVDEAVSKIRGEIGTTVKVTVNRQGETKTFTITRDNINNPSVDAKIANGIGIMTISRFDEETGALAKKAAQNFKNKSVKGVVLDLRGNGGGFVTAAVDVAGLWLNDKTVMSERSGGMVRETKKTESQALLDGIPTIVLVNGSSASASEIVAGALQDYKVAKLVGEKTFGKGSVQQLITLNSGAELKVTIARWYTPKGRNITKEGIKPDVAIGISQADVDKGADPQLDKAVQLLGK